MPHLLSGAMLLRNDYIIVRFSFAEMHVKSISPESTFNLFKICRKIYDIYKHKIILYVKHELTKTLGIRAY